MADPAPRKEDWSGKVGSEWASHADRTDAMLGILAEAALKVGNFRVGEHVLDIGCGAGGTSVEIARRVAPSGSVLGVDVSPELLRVARARVNDLPLEFIEADAAAMKLGKAYDAAFSRLGVMFFDKPVAAFTNIRAQLRTGGHLVFVCWRTLAENKWATTPMETVASLLKSPLARPDPDAPGPFAFADSEKVEGILANAGWRNIVITPWDGRIPIGGAGELSSIADFVLRIGPCARVVADQALDEGEVKRRLIDQLSPFYRDGSVMLPAACWLVAADA